MKKILKTFITSIIMIVAILKIPTYAASTCGNHQIEEAEQCDDGNINDSDGCSSSCKYELQNEKTIILRTPENFWNEETANRQLTLFKQKGITTIIFLVKNDEDVPGRASGEVFYNSTIAPISKDYDVFDALTYSSQYARDNDMKIYAWVPQFHDQALINSNPDLQMSYLNQKNNKVEFYNPNDEYFVNPISTTSQDYQKDILREIVTNYDIDGVFLDWVRFDDYFMDMSDSTRDEFQSLYGIDATKIDFLNANNQRTIWNNYRQDKIADYINSSAGLVKSINPKLSVGVFILPIEMEEVAQNPSKFENSIDFVSPMLYNDDWGYPESWIYEKAIADLKNNMVNESKILITLDLDDCGKADLWDKISQTGVNQKACFWWNKWTDKEIDIAFNHPIRADVDGENGITIDDALLTLRNSVGLDISLTNWKASSTTGDVNCDGVSNSTDAMLILRDSRGSDMSKTEWCIK